MSIPRSPIGFEGVAHGEEREPPQSDIRRFHGNAADLERLQWSHGRLVNQRRHFSAVRIDTRDVLKFIQCLRPPVPGACNERACLDLPRQSNVREGMVCPRVDEHFP